MSRIGKQEILIPAGVTVIQSGNTLTVKGSKGSLSKVFRDDITITLSDKVITLGIKRNDKFWIFLLPKEEPSLSCSIVYRCRYHAYY